MKPIGGGRKASGPIGEKKEAEENDGEEKPGMKEKALPPAASA